VLRCATLQPTADGQPQIKHRGSVKKGNEMKKIRIGALISGGGTNLQAIIDACENGSIDGEMVFVGSDQPGAKGLERAKTHSTAPSCGYIAAIQTK
jgi:hypothetical protein